MLKRIQDIMINVSIWIWFYLIYTLLKRYTARLFEIFIWVFQMTIEMLRNILDINQVFQNIVFLLWGFWWIRFTRFFEDFFMKHFEQLMEHHQILVEFTFHSLNTYRDPLKEFLLSVFGFPSWRKSKSELRGGTVFL